MALTGLGFLLLFAGVIFLFDRGLLAMGNVSAGDGRVRRRAAPQRPPSSWLRHRPLALPTLQVLFLVGVALTIGPQSTIKFFMRPKNFKVSSASTRGAAHPVPVQRRSLPAAPHGASARAGRVP